MMKNAILNKAMCFHSNFPSSPFWDKMREFSPKENLHLWAELKKGSVQDKMNKQMGYSLIIFVWNILALDLDFELKFSDFKERRKTFINFRVKQMLIKSPRSFYSGKLLSLFKWKKNKNRASQIKFCKIWKINFIKKRSLSGMGLRLTFKFENLTSYFALSNDMTQWWGKEEWENFFLKEKNQEQVK